MKFFPYALLLELAQGHEKLRTEEGRIELIRNLEVRNDLRDLPELIAFISGLDQQKLVFIQWIGQNNALQQFLLENGLPKVPFKDTYKWLEHLLFAEFRIFLKPFLLPRILQFSSETDPEKIKLLFSYLILLPEEDRMFNEQLLYRSVENETKRLVEETNRVKSSKELLKLFTALSSANVLSITQGLSRSSYHLRIAYVDRVLEVLNNKWCTPLLAGRILDALQTLDLNPEHDKKLSELRRELKGGKLITDEVPFFQRLNRKVYFGLVAFAILVSLTIFLALWRPSTENEPLTGDVSSFEQFSIDERKQIDSLLRSRYGQGPTDSTEYDQYLWQQGSGLSLAIRNKLRNVEMEKVYNDWLLDAELHLKGLFTNCDSLKRQKTLSSGIVKPIDSYSGKEQMFLLNESAYTVIMYVFKDQRNSPVYAKLIPSGKEINFNIDRADKILFVAGNVLVPFVKPPHISDVPSTEFREHFCETDQNLQESLSIFYSLDFPFSGKNKLMLRGDANSPFYVADLYGILGTY
jgi:hypothetical protein